MKHVITGIGQKSVVVLIGDQREMNPEDVNDYMIKQGWLDYAPVTGSHITDHQQGVTSIMYFIDVPLFDREVDMIAYYQPDLN